MAQCFMQSHTKTADAAMGAPACRRASASKSVVVVMDTALLAVSIFVVLLVLSAILIALLVRISILVILSILGLLIFVLLIQKKTLSRKSNAVFLLRAPA